MDMASLCSFFWRNGRASTSTSDVHALKRGITETYILNCWQHCILNDAPSQPGGAVYLLCEILLAFCSLQTGRVQNVLRN